MVFINGLKDVFKQSGSSYHRNYLQRHTLSKLLTKFKINPIWERTHEVVSPMVSNGSNGRERKRQRGLWLKILPNFRFVTQINAKSVEHLLFGLSSRPFRPLHLTSLDELVVVSFQSLLTLFGM
jgi:hypothetical protein